MDLSLNRIQYRPDGIFSQWDGPVGPVFVSVTHAFPDGHGGWKPVIPPGRYLCQRGHHTIGHGVHAHLIETFEITGVAGHTGLLVHPGNFNTSSEGCECPGRTIIDPDGEGPKPEMVTHSEETFRKFMDLQEDVDKFWLTVRDAA